MKNLNITLKDLAYVVLLFFGMGSAWMSVQADVSRLTHATKENARSSLEGDKRNIQSLRRMEDRLNKRLDRNYFLSKKIRSEAN